MADAIYPALHGRQHCPGGEDPIPCMPVPRVFRASQWDNDLTTPTGVDMEPIKFDKWSNPGEEWFGTELDVDGHLFKIAVVQPGLVVATLLLTWTSGFDFSVAGLIEDDEGVFPPAGNESTRKMRAGHNTGMSYSYTLSRYYPTIDFELDHGGVISFAQLAAYAGQASGSAQDVQGRMDVAWWPAQIGTSIESSV